MSVEDGVGAAAPQADVEMVKALLGLARGADDGDVLFAGAMRTARVLFAQIAAAKMNSSALQLVMETDRHPMFVRRFAAIDVNGNRQSWSRQEERLLKRYAAAQERVRDARVICEAAETKRLEAEAKLENVSIDMALMRVNLMLRGMQEFVRPALDAGPLVTLALAVLGDPATADDPALEGERAAAKRTLDVLTRRISDDAFLHSLGQLIREFVSSYDEVAGAERRLSWAAAEDVRDGILRDHGLLARITTALAYAAPAAAEDHETEASGLAQTEASEAGDSLEEGKVQFPF